MGVMDRAKELAKKAETAERACQHEMSEIYARLKDPSLPEDRKRSLLSRLRHIEAAIEQAAPNGGGGKKG